MKMQGDLQSLSGRFNMQRKHTRGLYERGSSVPYVAHPMETMMLVASMTSDNEVIAAAALHDVVEDTPITIAQIEQEFGATIAMYVAHESENKRGTDRKVRHGKYESKSS